MTSAMIALVMFLPRYNALTVGDWVKYFGLGFGLIAVQYLVPLLIMISAPASWLHAYPLNLFKALCSAFNSVLFLAAAISLFGRTNLFPRWVIIFASLAALVASFDAYTLQYPWLFWVRLPDALLSALCLGALGLTIGSNISFHWRKGLAFSASVVAVMYATILIVYGFHPVLAKNNIIEARVGPSNEEILKIQGKLSEEQKPKNTEEIRFEETLRHLDVLAFAISWPLKLGLFIPAYVLLIFILKASEQSDQLLERLSKERLSYLSGPGIVQLVGEQLKADKVELLFLIPGAARRVAGFNWSLSRGDEEIAEVKRLDDDPLLVKVMNDGRVRRQLGSGPSLTDPFITEEELGFNYRHLVAGVYALLVPIKYNGAVVGCLRIDQDSSRPLSETAIQQAKSFARLLTLLTQPYRYLAALDQISYRCGRLQVEHNIKNSEEAVKELVNIVDEILSPLATGMFLRIGFKQQQQVVGRNSIYKNWIHSHWEDLRSSQKSAELRRIYLSASTEELDAYETPLVANLSDEAHFAAEQQIAKDKGPRIGDFIFIARADKDEINKPTLGMFYLHRKAISSIISDALLDLARDAHSDSLKQFSLAVSAEDVGVEKWFQALEDAAKAADLLWAVSIAPSAEKVKESGGLGTAEHVALVERLMKSHKAKIESSIELWGYALVRLEEVSPQARSVIFMRLEKTKWLISFGIERASFGVEFKFDSPWKAFLFALRDLANSTLDRILKDTEFRRIQIEASQNQALATVAATTGTIIHQLVNMTRDQMSGSSTLKAALRMKKLLTEDERLKRIIHNMSESGRSMLELTQSITNITKVDDTCPCNLVKAIKHARDLFSISIAQSGIDFKYQVDPNLMIAVPYYAAALALANLVGNSKDALRAAGGNHSDKQIQVTAEEVQDVDGNEWIHCHVTDTGPGISEGNREKVFHVGFSTKLNSGGWGLYLVKRALRENGSDVELTHPGPNHTTFSIKFPRAKRTP
jgi:signal transduction histidine kinase